MPSFRILLLAAITCLMLFAVPSSVAAVETAPSTHEIAEAFPWVWKLGYRNGLPLGTQIKVAPHEVSMVAQTAKGPQRVKALGNFGYRDGSGTFHWIDTVAEKTTGGFRPAATPYSLLLPSKYADGVAFRASGTSNITLTPVGASTASTGVIVGGDQVMYSGAWSDTSIVATILGSGMREHIVLGSSAAPKRFAWKVGLTDAALELRDRAVWIVAGKERGMLISPPFAVDAVGNSVEVNYALARTRSGYLLTLAYGSAHDAATGVWRPVAYPLAIDPDVNVPFGSEEIGCGTVGDPGGGISADGSSDQALLQFSGYGGPRAFAAGAYASCTYNESMLGPWVSFSADYTYHAVADLQSVSILDDAGVGPLDGAVGDVPVAQHFSFVPFGDVTLELSASDGFSLGTSSVRYLGLQNIVRVVALPVVLGRPSNAAASDVGFGFAVTQATGNVTTTVPDVAQSSYAGMPLGITRTYNSEDEHVGLLGKGWTTSYERRLEIDSATNDVTYVAADGGRWTFTSASATTWNLALGQERALRLNSDSATNSAEPYELVYVDGHVERFTSIGRLAREVWPMGNAITYGAPIAAVGGTQFSVSDGHGHSITGFISSASDRLTKVTDSLSKDWSYGFTGAGLLSSVTDPSGGVWEFAYNSAGRMSTAEDPKNRATTFEYDAFGYATTVTDPGTAQRSFGYDLVQGTSTDTFGTHITDYETNPETGATISVTNPEGDSASMVYNERGQITSAIDEAGEVTAATFDVNGCKTSETDAEMNTTLYANMAVNCHPQTVTDAANHATVYTYDASGNKLTETTPSPDSQITAWTYDTTPLPATVDPPAGATLSYSYSATGGLTDQTWVDGSSVVHYVEQNVYDIAGRLTSHAEGALAPSTYTYDGIGRPVRTTDPLNKYVENTYDDAGQLINTRDKNAGVSTFGYDVRGNQNSTEDLLLNTTNSVTDKYGDMTSTTDERNKTTAFTYNEVGDEMSETDPLLHTTSFTYDKVGNQLTETVPGPITTSTSYDGNASELGSVNPDTSTTGTTYTALGQQYVVTDEALHTTTYGYDVVGRDKTVTNGEGEVTETFYDAAGRVSARENGLDQRTAYTLDPLGRVTVQTNPDTVTATSATWDDAGRKLSSTDERSKTTSLTYDAVGRVLAEVRPGLGTFSFTYDAVGNKLTETNPLLKTTTYTYYADNRLHTEQDPTGGVTTYAYDPAGNLLSVTDPLNKVTSYMYDDAGRRTSMTDPKTIVTSYLYNARDEMTDETVNGVTTSYVYNNRGLISTVTKGSSVTSYTYYANGPVRTQTMPDGSIISYTYDGDDRVLTEVHSVRGTTSYVYDDAGLIVTETTAGGTTTYVRDLMGRVKSIAHPGTTTVSYTYDAAGNILTVTDVAGTRTLTRNDSGRVATFTTARGKAGTYTYDTVGRKTGSTYYNRNNVLITRSWVYDAAGRVTTFGSGFGSFTYTYTTAGQLATRTFPDAKVETYTYDDKGRTKTQQLSTQPLLTYTYDDSDRITKLETTLTSVTSNVHRYAYSANGQLLTWWNRKDAYKTDYTYDAGGNLEQISRSLTTAPIGTNTSAQDTAIAACFTLNRVGCAAVYGPEIDYISTILPPDVDPVAFTGNRALVARYMLTHAMPIRTYVHNSAGQITSLRNLNYTAAAETYTYDTRGNQVNGGTLTYDYSGKMTARTSAWTSAQYAHDGDLYNLDQAGTVNDIELDYDDEGKLLWTFQNNLYRDFINDQVGYAGFKQSNTGEMYFPYFNTHGDAISYHRKLSGTVEPWRYTPHGDTDWASTYPIPMYNGRDGSFMLNVNGSSTTGDVLMGARVYNFVQGRFRQTDPLPGRSDVTDTAYSYASNDPINRIDPDGRLSLPTAELNACVKEVKSNLGFCGVMAITAQQANEIVASIYGTVGHNNSPDAFKHTLWNSMMVFQAKINGYSHKKAFRIATKIGIAHEKACKGPSCRTERRMDLHNNVVGRSLVGRNEANGPMAVSSIRESVLALRSRASNALAGSRLYTFANPADYTSGLRYTDVRDGACAFRGLCSYPYVPIKTVK